MVNKKRWFVYILECSNKTLYTGITSDVSRRIKEHNSGKGAKYTRAFGPVVLKRQEIAKNHSAALKREAKIKRMSRQDKIRLIENDNNDKAKS